MHPFLVIFSSFGLIGVVGLGLHVVALKVRTTPLAWVLAFALGLVAAYAAEFGAEIAMMMAFKGMPFQPWSVAFYAVIALAGIWVSGHAKVSSWPVSIPCFVVAVLAFFSGISTGNDASIYAGIITAIIGAACWFIVPILETHPVRYFFTSLLTLFVGGIVFSGIASLVGLVFPAAQDWVFWILMAGWAWIGWKYSGLRDKARLEGRAMGRSDIDPT